MAHGNGTSSHSLDVTQGVIWRQLVALFLPVLAGTVFQEVYTLANAYVIGRYASLTALGAIQATATLTDLTISISMGVGIGCSVIVSQYFGARDDRRLQDAVHTAVALSLALGICCSVIGLLGAGPLLALMGTPADLMPESLEFMYAYFGAVTLPIMFNMLTALQRAVGDTRTPAIITAFGCLVNVALDFLLIGFLKMGVRGAALATAGSYLVGSMLAASSLMRADGAWRLHPSRIRIAGPIARDMLACALPLAAQNAVFPLSNMVVQSTVNSFGSDVVIAWGLQARIGWMRRGLHVSLVLATLVMGASEALVCLFSQELSALFAQEPTIVGLTSLLVRLTVPFYVIFSFMDIIAGVIRGAGESLRPMLIIILGTCVLRIAWMLGIVPRFHSIVTVVVSYPVTWLVTTLLFVVYYRHGRWLTRALRTARRRRADV